MKETWLATDMAADYLNVSDALMRAWCRDGRLDARKGDRGEWLIPLSKLAEVKAKRRHEQPAPVSIDKLAAIYAELGSLHATAQVVKISQNTVAKRLRDAGYKINRMGNPHRSQKAIDSKFFYDMAIEFAKHGLILRRESMCPRPCPAIVRFVDRDCLIEGCFLEEVEGIQVDQSPLFRSVPE